MTTTNYNIQSITTQEISDTKNTFGHNALTFKKENRLIDAIF